MPRIFSPWIQRSAIWSMFWEGSITLPDRMRMVFIDGFPAMRVRMKPLGVI